MSTNPKAMETIRSLAESAKADDDKELAVILYSVLGSLHVPEYKSQLCALLAANAAVCSKDAKAKQVLCGTVAK